MSLPVYLLLVWLSLSLLLYLCISSATLRSIDAVAVQLRPRRWPASSNWWRPPCYFAAILQKMDTSMGLSSIATLSLGLSMSMAGAGRAVIRTLGTVPGSFEGRQSLQQLFPVLPLGVPLAKGGSTRRPSPGFVNSLQPNKWRSRLQGSKRTKSVSGDSRGRSADHTPAEGRRDTTSTTTSGKSSSVDIPPLYGRSDSTIDSRINATSEENAQMADTRRSNA